MNITDKSCMIYSDKKSNFAKVMRMSTKKLFFVIFLFEISFQETGICQNETNAAFKISTAGSDRQLKINRDTLLKGSSEQIRVDAASEMLFSTNPVSRKILIETLRQSENSHARTAVCKSLSLARASQLQIKNKDDFIEPLIDILKTETDLALAKQLCQAMLIFEYEQIKTPLDKLFADPDMIVAAKINAIEMLKAQPDMKAIFKLIELTNDEDSLQRCLVQDNTHQAIQV